LTEDLNDGRGINRDLRDDIADKLRATLESLKY
jgi:hypothetical protein